MGKTEELTKKALAFNNMIDEKIYDAIVVKQHEGVGQNDERGEDRLPQPIPADPDIGS